MNEDANSTIAGIIEAAPLVLEDAGAIDPPAGADGDQGEAADQLEGGEVGQLEADEDDKPRGPRDLGYDVDSINAEYALVLLGSKAVVFLDQPEAPVDDQQRILTLEAFHAWHANTRTEVRGADGKIRAMTWSARWLKSRDRRSYRGVEFHPDPDMKPGTKGYLNMWSGFAVEPKQGAGKYDVFRDHLMNNVCMGDASMYAWVFGFFAHMMQKPRDRLGVGIVLRGAMGSGKTKIGETFGSLIPRHYFLVDDPRYVTGQFNAHMATCLLLQADEAVWAGDKAAEGRLKGLVTSPIQQIESKGIDPIRLKNYVRLIMTSNEDWVVPAGKDERRFCVLDVDARCAQNHDYFREMDEELDAGGRQALLYDLLHFDLSKVNLRKIPKTEALLEQKLRSLDSIDTWLYTRLWEGVSLRNGESWLAEVTVQAMVDDYIAAADRIGIKRRSTEVELAKRIMKTIPGVQRVRGYFSSGRDESGKLGSTRPWLWRFPPLAECRAAFADSLQQAVAWPAETPGTAPVDDGPFDEAY